MVQVTWCVLPTVAEDTGNQRAGSLASGERGPFGEALGCSGLLSSSVKRLTKKLWPSINRGRQERKTSWRQRVDGQWVGKSVNDIVVEERGDFEGKIFLVIVVMDWESRG